MTVRQENRTQLLIHLAPALLNAGGYDATLEDGTRVSAEMLRRVACDSWIVPITLDDQGEPLSVGRKTRSISPSIRRALVARDGTCRFPGCAHRRDEEGLAYMQAVGV